MPLESILKMNRYNGKNRNWSAIPYHGVNAASPWTRKEDSVENLPFPLHLGDNAGHWLGSQVRRFRGDLSFANGVRNWLLKKTLYSASVVSPRPLSRRTDMSTACMVCGFHGKNLSLSCLMNLTGDRAILSRTCFKKKLQSAVWLGAIQWNVPF